MFNISLRRVRKQVWELIHPTLDYLRHDVLLSSTAEFAVKAVNCSLLQFKLASGWHWLRNLDWASVP